MGFAGAFLVSIILCKVSNCLIQKVVILAASRALIIALLGRSFPCTAQLANVSKVVQLSKIDIGGNVEFSSHLSRL